MKKSVQLIVAYVFMVLSTITPLCAQEYIRTSQTLVADTAIIRESMNMDFIMTRRGTQCSFHCHDDSRTFLVSFDVPDNIIVTDFEINDQKIIDFCGYIPGNPDRAVIGQLGAGEFHPYMPATIRFFYALLPNVDGAVINRLNKIESYAYYNEDWQFHIVAVGDWNGSGHCIVEFHPSVLDSSSVWNMAYITDRTVPEIFDDVALSDNYFYSVSQRGNDSYIRRFKLLSGYDLAITASTSWQNDVIKITNNPASSFRITARKNDTVYVAGRTNTSPLQTEIYKVLNSNYWPPTQLNSLKYYSPSHPRDIRFSYQHQILYLLQEYYEKDGFHYDCIFEFYPLAFGGVAANAKYSQFKHLYSFSDAVYTPDKLTAVGRYSSDNIFMFRTKPLVAGSCIYEFTPPFWLDQDHYTTEPRPQPYGETDFLMQLQELPLYLTPITDYCR